MDQHPCEGPGTLREEYAHWLVQDATPYALSVPQRIPIPLQEVVQAEQ